MKKLIVFCGTKQSGKTSSAAIMMGYHLVQLGIIPNINISEDDRLFISYENKEFNFDIESQDPALQNWMNDIVYPHIQNVGFADTLKDVVSKQFGIDHGLMWGSNDDKNSETHIMLDALQPLISDKRYEQLGGKNRPITVREMLEIFGTDICRQIDPECHIRSAFDVLERSGTEIGVITDCRFANEFEYCQRYKKKNKNVKCLIVKLERTPFKSTAISEQGLPEIDLGRYDNVFKNADMTFADKSKEVVNFFINQNVLAKSDVGVKNAN